MSARKNIAAANTVAPDSSDAGAPASYLTLRAGKEATGEFVDRKSRFIAQLIHVESEEGAAAFIEQIRARHYDARHNVPAQILASGFEKASDDGEPSRTAGMPVLDVLRGANLKDACCVVTRYFGGTLLGPGGLVRAYGAATAQALESAREQNMLVEMTSVVPVSLTVAYNTHDRVRDIAQRFGAHIITCDYADQVTLSLTFKEGSEQGFLTAMKELFNGESPCCVEPARFAEF